jgi:hypothetical protein
MCAAKGKRRKRKEYSRARELDMRGKREKIMGQKRPTVKMAPNAHSLGSAAMCN